MIGVYLRISSGQGQDLKAQRAELERWAKTQDQPCQTYADTATGTNMDRPQWERLWADACQGKVSKIVVWRLDRLGRTAKGLINLRDELLSRRIGFLSLRDSLDLDTPSGRLMFNIIASVAEYETEVRRERQLIGVAKAKEEGRYNGRKPGARGKRTAEVREAVLTLKAQGKSIAEIARVTKVSRPTIYAILSEQEA
jgi:DNA invertase Pin-like site-specific DNA recombinase